MEVTTPSTPVDDGREPLARTLAVQRQRVRDFLSAQRQRVERIEAELAQRIQQCQEDLLGDRQEIARRQAELDDAETSLRREQKSLQLDQEQQQAEREHLNAVRQQLEQRSAELDARQQQIASDHAQTESQRRRIAHELRAQHAANLREIARRRAELEQLPMAAPAPATATGEPNDDLDRRLEMAMEDLHEMKARNAELERQLAQAQQAKTHESSSPGGTLSWEAQKQRILAALETQSEGEGDEPDTKRIEMEEVIRTTDQALADKDREIEEMRQVLKDQSSNLGSVAVGAAALGEMLDQDALIREERENLQRLKEQWEEKLRQAEIDLSLERAKIARQRADLEEKLRAYQSNVQGAPDEAASAQADKPSRGRWLARLGLKDLEQGT